MVVNSAIAINIVSAESLLLLIVDACWLKMMLKKLKQNRLEEQDDWYIYIYFSLYSLPSILFL